MFNREMAAGPAGLAVTTRSRGNIRRTNKLFIPRSGALVLALSLSIPWTLAQASCAYLAKYDAPLNLPVNAWPEALAGPSPETVEQRSVGPDECPIVGEKIIHNAYGIPYRQVTIGVSGSVFGFAPVDALALPPLGTGRAGEGRGNTFSDHAFIWQTQGTMGPFVPGTGYYEYSDETPVGVEILFPRDRRDWNGIMWVLVHGAGRFPPLRLPLRKPNTFNRYEETSLSAGALIDRGYAVVWTRRDAAILDESSLAVANTVRLDNGVQLGGVGKLGMGFNDHLGIIRDYTVISRNYLEEQYGERPKFLFYRGHSAGGATGRSFITIPGMNTDHDGEMLFHGFYLDDTAGGRGGPTFFWESQVIDEYGTFKLIPTETDRLTFGSDHMRFMAPVIDVFHGAYSGGTANIDTVPRVFKLWPATYIQNKREIARQVLEKGLGDWWRFYEIAGVSHSDASADARDYPELAAEMVDIGGISIRLEQALVDWVVKGNEPPPSRIDAVDVQELDPKAGPAIQLPETACPRGIYRTYMNRPDGTSVGSSPALFIPYLTEAVPQIDEFEDKPPPGFKTEWLEPLDSSGYRVDMTGSHKRMTRPSIEQAWHVRYREGYKTGILRPDESLTRERYVACVTSVAASLRKAGLLTEAAEQWYRGKAQKDKIGVD